MWIVLRQTNEKMHFYRKQTKFGARQYFQKSVSFCSRGSLYDVTSRWLPGPMFLLRSLCLGGSLCKGSLSGGLCPGEPLSRGVSLQSGLCLGGLCPGGLCPGNLCTGDSVQGVYVGDGGGRAVRILLECFLVLPKQMKSPDPVSRFG